MLPTSPYTFKIASMTPFNLGFKVASLITKRGGPQVLSPLCKKLYYQHFLFSIKVSYICIFKKCCSFYLPPSISPVHLCFLIKPKITVCLLFFPQFRGPCLGSEQRRWKGKARTASMIQVGVRSRPGMRPEGEAAIDSYWRRTAY